MFRVVMKAMYGVTYTVANNLSYEKAVEIKSYVLSTNDESYFDNLFIKSVEIEHERNGFSYDCTRI